MLGGLDSSTLPLLKPTVSLGVSSSCEYTKKPERKISDIKLILRPDIKL
jgi:hypothetical protein